jgi:hypothetical protein
LFCGQIDLSEDKLEKIKIDHISHIASYAADMNDSIKNAGKYLAMAVEDFAKKNL